MKKRRNRLISIALSIGLCAGLAACSGNSGSSDSGKKEDGKTEVTIWIREQMEAPVTAAVEQYNKQQDEVQVPLRSPPEKYRILYLWMIFWRHITIPFPRCQMYRKSLRHWILKMRSVKEW